MELNNLILECKKEAARLLKNKKISYEELETFVKFSNDPIRSYNHEIAEKEKILADIKAKKDILVEVQKKVVDKYNNMTKDNKDIKINNITKDNKDIKINKVSKLVKVNS